MADMSKEDAPTIRIVRKKVVGGGHHGGAWKVAYADFVTAMMAFFLVMWIVGLNKPIRAAIASYFRDPSGFMKTSHGGADPMGAGQEKSKPKATPAPLIPQDGGFGGRDATIKAHFEEAAKAIEKQLQSNPEFHELRDSVKVTLTSEGLRIELIEKTSSLFFDSGSASLKERSIHLLSVIAKELGKLDNPVVLEGHTDSRPLNGANGYSNWELSTDRANSARKAMESRGLHSKQVIAVRGYADRRLLRKDDPTHFSNRRVSILVPYSAKKTDEGKSEEIDKEIAGGAGIKPDLAAEAKASSSKSEGGTEANNEQGGTEGSATK